MRHAVDVVVRRTGYVRAMNFVLASGKTLRIVSRFSEDPAYFTMYRKETATRQAVCSEAFAGDAGWLPIPNGTVLEWA